MVWGELGLHLEAGVPTSEQSLLPLPIGFSSLVAVEDHITTVLSEEETAASPTALAPVLLVPGPYHSPAHNRMGVCMESAPIVNLSQALVHLATAVMLAPEKVTPMAVVVEVDTTVAVREVTRVALEAPATQLSPPFRVTLKSTST